MQMTGKTFLCQMFICLVSCICSLIPLSYSYPLPSSIISFIRRTVDVATDVMGLMLASKIERQIERPAIHAPIDSG